jgi:predicted chitinase
MNSIMGSYLTTACHWAAFLGNVGTESAQLTEWTQVPCDSATDSPYCGRGPLQITGSSNYDYCASETSYCGCSSIGSDPELVSSDTSTGFGTAACVWAIMSGHDLSENADGTLAGFKETACYINAGTSPCGDPNGWSSRQSYWNTANSCLGISSNDNEYLADIDDDDDAFPTYGIVLIAFFGAVIVALSVAIAIRLRAQKAAAAEKSVPQAAMNPVHN